MAYIKKNSPMGRAGIVIGGSDGGGHTFKSTIIVNSGVMSIGDVVAVVSGAGVANSVVVRRYNAAGDKILGVCVGFGQASGAAVAFDSGSNTTVTVGAANETTGAQVFARVDITQWATWSVNFSAPIHTTATFGYGALVDPDTGANAGRLLESSVTRTQSTERGCIAWGPDPDDTTRGLVCIVEGPWRGANAAS